jgi:hypothetical protein
MILLGAGMQKSGLFRFLSHEVNKEAAESGSRKKKANGVG